VFFPYRVETGLKRLPVANFLVIAACVIIYFKVGPPEPGWTIPFERLAPFESADVFTYMWLHAGLFHLIGNMLFLWVFGNAVCERLGNLAYPFVYVGLGVFAGAVHWLLDGRAAIGASGAICGVVGIFVVWFPKTRVTCLWFLLIVRSFSVSSIWPIFFWMVFDVIGVIVGGSNVAHWAHIGGYLAGVAIGYLLVLLDLVEIGPNGETLFGVGSRRRARRATAAVFRVRTASSETVSEGPRGVIPMAPPEDYFVTLRCQCGAEVRRPRPAASDRVVCGKCGAVMESAPPNGA